MSPEPTGFHYVGDCIRPPSEANSILLQATLGCSHNKCTFCRTFRQKRFSIKDHKYLESDLEFAAKYCKRQRRVFIMDGDALVMPMREWRWLLGGIHEKLPWVERIGTYGNAKSVALKSDEDLVWLKEQGVGIVYYGLESGHPEILKRINKGSTPEKLIKQGRRIIEAGMKLSVTVILGLAGDDAALAKEHAQATGQVLSEIDPEFVGALTLMITPGTPLFDEQEAGRFRLPEPWDMVAELREMIAHTTLSSGLFYANHASNYLPVKARLPKDKEDVLAQMDAALKRRQGLKPEWLRGL